MPIIAFAHSKLQKKRTQSVKLNIDKPQKPEFPKLEMGDKQKIRTSLGLYARQQGRYLAESDSLGNWSEQARVLEQLVNELVWDNQNVVENESFIAGAVTALYHFVGASVDQKSPPPPRFSSKAGAFVSPVYNEEAKEWEFDERQALKETLQDFVDTGGLETWSVSWDYFQILTHASVKTTEKVTKRKLFSAYLDDKEFTIDLGKDEEALRIPLDQIVETDVRQGQISLLTYSSKELPIYGGQYIIVKEKEKEKS